MDQRANDRAFLLAHTPGQLYGMGLFPTLGEAVRARRVAALGSPEEQEARMRDKMRKIADGLLRLQERRERREERRRQAGLPERSKRRRRSGQPDQQKKEGASPATTAGCPPAPFRAHNGWICDEFASCPYGYPPERCAQEMDRAYERRYGTSLFRPIAWNPEWLDHPWKDRTTRTDRWTHEPGHPDCPAMGGLCPNCLV